MLIYLTPTVNTPEVFEFNDPLYHHFASALREIEHLEERVTDKQDVIDALKASSTTSDRAAQVTETILQYNNAFLDRSEERESDRLRALVTEYQTEMQESEEEHERVLTSNNELEEEVQRLKEVLKEKEDANESDQQTIRLLEKKVGSLRGDVKRKERIIEQKDKSRADLIKDHNEKTFEMNKKIGSRDTTIQALSARISKMEARLHNYDHVPCSPDLPSDSQVPGRSPFYPGSPCANCQVIDHWSPDCTKPCIHCGSSSHLESATCDAYYHDLTLKLEAEADDSETGFSHPKRVKIRHEEYE